MATWLLAAGLALQWGLPAHELAPQEAVLSLPPEIAREYEERVLDQAGSAHHTVRETTDFLFDEAGMALSYRNLETLTVAEAFQRGEANCLSATMAFLVLAEQAGLNARAQRVEQALVWDRREDTVFWVEHVNAGVLAAGRRYTVDFEMDLIGGKSNPQVISRTRLIAHYYNNRAAELLAEDNLLSAYIAARHALSLDEGFSAAWNNLAIVERRLGRMEAAEASLM
ncbi:hypothetical protein [Natronospira sp.]|uniref:hypothetical protein n=1 Tax=Natronospira sp. TaxID=2024970 RepID=UPI0038733632